MPTLPMTPVLISRSMTRTRADGQQSLATINIGTPAVKPNSPSGVDPSYYCPVQFTGLQDDTIYPSVGIDPLQSLTLALCFAGTYLSSSPYTATVDDWDATFNFGFPELVVPPQPNIVSGTVQMEACNDPMQNITFEFRTPGTSPYDATNPVPALQSITQVLTPTAVDTGSFSISDVPDGTYDIAIKGFCWLRKVLPSVVVNGDVSGLTAFLYGGDINNDNVVDIADFGLLVNDYGTEGDP